MEKIKISAISYLNTLPFIYGLQNYESINEIIDIQIDIPSKSAYKILNNQVGIGLVPVAVLAENNSLQVISDYCIGAVREVRSVLLVSDVPIHDIDSIFLDYQSKTSINLVKVLAKFFWQYNPKWIPAYPGYENEIRDNIAGVIIGDRTFELSRTYKFTYDLAEEWIKFTNLPFVFATWMTNKPQEPQFLQLFNEALSYGIANIKPVVNQYTGKYINSKIDLYTFLTYNISYPFDVEKRKGLKLFLELIKKI